MALRSETELLPDNLREAFSLPDGSSYADAAGQLLNAIAQQKSLAAPSGFPLKRRQTRDAPGKPGEAVPPSSDNL